MDEDYEGCGYRPLPAQSVIKETRSWPNESPILFEGPPGCYCKTLRQRDACYEACEPMSQLRNRSTRHFVTLLVSIVSLLIMGAGGLITWVAFSHGHY